MLTLSANTLGAQALLESIARAKPAAVANALNRAAGAAQTLLVKTIAADLRVTQRDAKGQIRLSKARVYSSGPDPVTAASLFASAKRLALTAFKAKGPEPSRGLGHGVSWRMGGASKRAEHAFLATMRSGHRGVFIRVGTSQKLSSGAWGPNLPIKELKGPSFGHLMKKHAAAALARAAEMFTKTLAHELKFRSRKG